MGKHISLLVSILSFGPSDRPYMIPRGPFLLVFSPFHINIYFESTDSIFSTNDVSYLTAEFLDGYLRSYF